MILLSRGYAGYLAGTIVQLPAQEEASLIAQGFGVTSASPVTPGNVTTNKTVGRVGIAAAGSSVVVTNPAFTPESRFVAYLSNGGAADGTATSVRAIVPAAGSVTFTLNAAATAAVAIDWMQLASSQGDIPPN